MKAEVKQKWIKALTENPPPQCTGLFANPNQDGELTADGPHCVLGVLARELNIGIDNYASHGTLHLEWAEMAGIKCSSPEVVLTDAVLDILSEVQTPAIQMFVREHREELREIRRHESYRAVPLFLLNDIGVPFDALAKIIDLQFSEE